MSSRQNERTLGEGGVLEIEQGRIREEGDLGNLEQTYFLNVPFETSREIELTKIE